MIRRILIFSTRCGCRGCHDLSLRKSDAAQQQTSIGAPRTGRALPNFDVRLTARGEFRYDLSSIPSKQDAMQNTRARSSGRLSNFVRLSQLRKPQNLGAIVNDASATKNFFIDGAPVSDPQSNTTDNIARKFLNVSAMGYFVRRVVP